MEHAYVADRWHDVFVMVGSASAALMGLLFIALSLHVRPITRHPEMRGRARQTLASLLTVLALSLFMLIPQSGTMLGAELVVLAVADLWHRLPIQFSLVRSGLASTGSYWRYPTFDLAILSILASGISLLVHGPLGLFILVPAVAVIIVLCTVNAWGLLVNIGDESNALDPISADRAAAERARGL